VRVDDPLQQERLLKPQEIIRIGPALSLGAGDARRQILQASLPVVRGIALVRNINPDILASILDHRG